MTLRYGYICEEHGSVTTDFRADSIWCPHGETTHGAKRDWRFHADYSFQPYFAPSFGQVVKSRTHARDLAKIASEEATLRTGIPHDYRVIDTHDDEAAGVDTAHKLEVLDNTRRHAVNGAVWSQERLKEIEAHKAKVTAERKKVDA